MSYYSEKLGYVRMLREYVRICPRQILLYCSVRYGIAKHQTCKTLVTDCDNLSVLIPKMKEVRVFLRFTSIILTHSSSSFLNTLTFVRTCAYTKSLSIRLTYLSGAWMKRPGPKASRTYFLMPPYRKNNIFYVP